ncbi:FtsK/SpoIIIE family DNA translocase [Desulforamulus hydrothermalis]|uniref:DNA translocase FtsK n=1 Tax=Desulforamulus hydrothermalis Lam5 = DSM 18033 TaxID=1121428 RepID=K8ELQ9_9FIRM|nr:DNA translocase FtsK [Desulforamulus hydrothermalis]CCO09401.1 DNA translocase FtsK [Desulforamulus hydrothermalis Lam5 = DSM 18033]SHH08912.1 DNA translocase FtsK [Desulforamulus hydrothermalis Lam5 = DSM 18033]
MDLLKKLRDDLKYEIFGILLISIAVLGFISYANTPLGAVGGFVGRVLKGMFGNFGGLVLMSFLGLFGIKLIIERNRTPVNIKAYGAVLLFFIILTVLSLLTPLKPSFIEILAGIADETAAGQGGGLVGAVIAFLLIKSFGQAGTYILLTAGLLVALLLMTNTSMATLAEKTGSRAKQCFHRTGKKLNDFLFTEVEEDLPSIDGKTSHNPVIIQTSPDPGSYSEAPWQAGRNDDLEKTGPLNLMGRDNLKQSHQSQQTELATAQVEEEIGASFTQLTLQDVSTFKLPPLNLLSRPLKGSKNISSAKDITENIAKLEETLESFGIKAKVTQVSRGPAITRYEIQPPAGVKVSRIVSLADDIALAMAAPDVRIEAPIPGKAAVGIEVPNKEISMVHIRDLLESKEFASAPSRLTVALGKDIAGTPIIADLTKMPHLLIAGATGAGKSVCINTLIASILFKATPDEVKFLMIDPKMVELATYNGIPHLVAPVVTNPKKAATTLRWAVREMERRYELFAKAGVRDIARYNNLFLEREPAQGQQPLPLMVVIIDELADLMMVAPADVEDAICRLAQMARAAGIHLVVATQRPSVDVITGLIKANIPSRISFAVSSQVDSRTILDMAGAEKLLGKGDMLFFPVGAPKPIRVQGAYLSDREVEDVVNYLKKQSDPVYDESVAKEEPKEQEVPEAEDELLPEAVKILIETGHASISMLQRRLHIGYARAARLIDIMEQKGIVGGYEGSKPRAVLMTMEQYLQTFKSNK